MQMTAEVVEMHNAGALAPQPDGDIWGFESYPWAAVIPGPMGATMAYNLLNAGEQYHQLQIENRFRPLGLERLCSPATCLEVPRHLSGVHPQVGLPLKIDEAWGWVGKGKVEAQFLGTGPTGPKPEGSATASTTSEKVVFRIARRGDEHSDERIAPAKILMESYKQSLSNKITEEFMTKRAAMDLSLIHI